MGKWAAALAAHLADEKISQPPTGALSKLPKGSSVSFGSEAVGGAANFQSGVAERPYRLTKDEGDEAHAVPWNDDQIERFVGRVATLMRRSLSASDADDLAERLHLRDVRGDDRRCCVECAHWRPGGRRCANHRAAGLHSAEVGADLAALPQRCPGIAGPGGGGERKSESSAGETERGHFCS